jgi:hypothetical protein
MNRKSIFYSNHVLEYSLSDLSKLNTRAIGTWDHVREGRWWWESVEYKECGLHLKWQVMIYEKFTNFYFTH